MTLQHIRHSSQLTYLEHQTYVKTQVIQLFTNKQKI